MPEEVVEAQVEEVGAEVAIPDKQTAVNLFHTDDPAEVLKRAMSTANALAPVLRAQGMVANISGKDHVQIEGWQTLGAMLGVTPVGVWTRKLDNGWEAKVNAQTLDGRVIGSAEGMCLASEDNWKDSDEFAIRSMAQTRAASKALASVLRFVVTLGGFSGTPAEEMSNGGGGGRKTGPATEGQRKWVLGHGNKGDGLLQKAKFSGDEREAIWAWGFKDGALQKHEASQIIECLKDGTEEGRAKLLEMSGAAKSEIPGDTDGLGEQPDESHPEDEDIPF